MTGGALTGRQRSGWLTGLIQGSSLESVGPHRRGINTGVGEVGALQVRPLKVGAAQVCPSQVSATQVGVLQVSPGKPRTGQPCSRRSV